MEPVLTDAEFEVLVAICEALAPQMEVEPRGFDGGGALDLGVAEGVAGAMESAASPAEQRQLRLALHLIDHPLTNALLGGNPKRFRRISLGERERLLRRWANSRVASSVWS